MCQLRECGLGKCEVSGPDKRLKLLPVGPRLASSIDPDLGQRTDQRPVAGRVGARELGVDEWRGTLIRGKRRCRSGSGVRDGSIHGSEKLLDARHRRFHPQCLDDGGSSVTGEPFKIDTAVKIRPLGWALQRTRQCLQNCGDGLGRRG